MDSPLSQETINMIEARLGKAWADAALRGMVLAIIVAPAGIALGLILLLLGVVVGVWGWALRQSDNLLWLAIVSSLIPVPLFYTASHFVFRWQARRAVVPLQRQTEGLIETARGVD